MILDNIMNYVFNDITILKWSLVPTFLEETH